MSWLLDLQLIHWFSYYLTLVFVLGTALRVRQYHAILTVLRTLPGRWPNLFKLVLSHRGIFLTWRTVLPGAVSLLLLLANMIAKYVFWPESHLTLRTLGSLWWAIPFVAGFGVAMLAFDVSGMVRITPINRPDIEKQFDLAESWLTSWVAPVVRFFSIGYINPRRMVSDQVRDALESVSLSINSNLWWISIQAALRMGYGLSLWAAFLLAPRELVGP